MRPSVTAETMLFLRNTYNFLTRKKAPEKHAARVKAISDQV